MTSIKKNFKIRVIIAAAEIDRGTVSLYHVTMLSVLRCVHGIFLEPSGGGFFFQVNPVSSYSSLLNDFNQKRLK